MDNKIKPINIELGKLKTQLDRVHAMMVQENFSYQMLESQFGMIRERNNALQEENKKAEQMVKDAMVASEKIRNDADEYEKGVKASAVVMHQKATVRFNELMERFSEEEKKQINEQLKKLEEIAV